MFKQVTICLILVVGGAQCLLKELISTNQRIEDYKYPVETHIVETEDGYKLKMFRIPNSPKLNNSASYRPVAILQHGFQSNSDVFVCNGPNNSLAYMLADNGYDVWIANSRGNTYSKENVNLTPAQSAFWKFNLQEIGEIDLRTMIDYALKTAAQNALHFIGHSQGTTAFFILMSSRPNYNDKIKTAHLLAPCAFFAHADTIQLSLTAPLVASPNSLGYFIFKNLEFAPVNGVLSRVIDTICGGDNINSWWCSPFFNLAIDQNEHTNQTAFGELLETHPAGGSSNQVIHNLQLFESKRFCKFDFGKKKNQELYSQDTPPDFDLKKIVSETYMYAAVADETCTIQDLETLISKMGKVPDYYQVPDNNFSHLDFIAGMQVKEYVNDRVIDICNNYEGF